MTFCLPLFFAAAFVADGAAVTTVPPGPVATGQHVAKEPGIESLTPHVLVTRQGRMLRLDYELLDGQGNKVTPPNRDLKPHFRIRRDGQEIASGDFEYG